MIKIAKTANISALADIEASTRDTDIIIGEHTFIDAFVKIKPAGGQGHFLVGNHCYLNAGSVFYTGNGIQMGDDVLIAANCTLAPVNHAYKDKNTRIRLQGFGDNKGGIVIEDDVWIGANCVILDGSVIREGCVIGAGSLVKGELNAYGVYGGSPLKKISERE